VQLDRRTGIDRAKGGGIRGVASRYHNG
jgi:hypothetical protein